MASMREAFLDRVKCISQKKKALGVHRWDVSDNQPGTNIVDSFRFSQLNDATSAQSEIFAELSSTPDTSARSVLSIWARTGPIGGAGGLVTCDLLQLPAIPARKRPEYLALPRPDRPVEPRPRCWVAMLTWRKESDASTEAGEDGGMAS